VRGKGIFVVWDTLSVRNLFYRWTMWSTFGLSEGQKHLTTHPQRPQSKFMIEAPKPLSITHPF
jgi:hypothetical protein